MLVDAMDCFLTDSVLGLRDIVLQAWLLAASIGPGDVSEVRERYRYRRLSLLSISVNSSCWHSHADVIRSHAHFPWTALAAAVHDLDLNSSVKKTSPLGHAQVHPDETYSETHIMYML